MTQDQFTLFTGVTVSYSDEDWETIIKIATERLALRLCMTDGWPDDPDASLLMLLANFLAGVFKYQGAGGTVTSKSVRNFTINFSDNADDVWVALYRNYGDLLDLYSECDSSITVESDAIHCCDGDQYYSNYTGGGCACGC